MPLQHYICTTCGVQYEASETAPGHCFMCEDDRQYVGAGGQNWTTLPELNKKHKNIIEMVWPGVYAIYTTPAFAIGQRAHLITTPKGNVLWDCITNLDATTVDIIHRLGGIKAIAISHPHYFSTIIEWSKAFDNAPVYINALDAGWLARKGAAIELWTEPALNFRDDMQLIRCGGHFPGASVLYWQEGNGVLFTGDTIQVTPAKKTVSFMYSYPNMIPLKKKEVLAIEKSVEGLQYDTMLGAFGMYIMNGAKEAMKISVKRYLDIYE